MKTFQLLQYVKCPHCKNEVDYELDDCSYCDKPIYDYDVKLEKDEEFVDDYLEFVSVPIEAKAGYKIPIFISFVSVFLSILWVISIAVKFDGDFEVPDTAYLMFFGGITSALLTEALIWFEKRKHNYRYHRSDYHHFDAA